MNEKKMNELAAAAQREYYRKWRKNNPDKVKAAQQRYWQKKGLELAAKSKE